MTEVGYKLKIADEAGLRVWLPGPGVILQKTQPVDSRWCLPEWGESWGESHGGAAVRVVIVQAESREVGGHVLLRQELLAQRLPRVQASRRPRGGPRVAQGPTRGTSFRRLLKDHWGSGSCG